MLSVVALLPNHAAARFVPQLASFSTRRPTEAYQGLPGPTLGTAAVVSSEPAWRVDLQNSDFAVACTAEIFSWCNLISQNNLFAVIEQSLWGIIFISVAYTIYFNRLIISRSKILLFKTIYKSILKK